MQTNELAGDRSDAVERLTRAREQILEQLGQVIVGQRDVIDELLISLFSRGHCLLEGVPGLAKTLMISTLARTLDLSFSRIQFTPDLMPADITGTEIIQEDRATGVRDYRFLEGPLFSHVILADEINRTPPKTQAALLEAMQERQVTVGRVRHKLSDPFFVLATQNPIEQEGTYPLPEASKTASCSRSSSAIPTSTTNSRSPGEPPRPRTATYHGALQGKERPRITPVTSAEPSLKVIGRRRIAVKSASATRQLATDKPTCHSASPPNMYTAIAMTGTRPIKTSTIIRCVVSVPASRWGEEAT